MRANTAHVLQFAMALGKASAGAFNCCRPGEAYPAPDNATVLEFAAGPHGPQACKTGPYRFDLGGVAKGYAVDAAIAVLIDAGIPAALINAGGDMRHYGAAPATIHLRNARHSAPTAAPIQLCNAALASSASNGLIAAHDRAPLRALIDGRTGSALPPDLGVAVIAPSCMVADGLTKVLLATGNPQHPLLAAYDSRSLHTDLH